MTKRRFYQNDDDAERSEEEVEESYAVSESDMVVDREDYDQSELDAENEWAEDLASETPVDTRHDEGHTYNPAEASEQGLTYTPPTDPPTLPGNNLEGAEIAAGFAPSMEETEPDEEYLPASVEDSDLEVKEDIYLALRDNSETGHLADRITVRVRDGVATLSGAVPGQEDIALVYDIVNELEGVVEVNSLLDTED